MRVLVRTDASEVLGLGHAARALALAEELGRRLGTVPVFLSRANPLLERFLDRRAVELAQVVGEGYALGETLAAVEPGDIVVSDTYALDNDALASLREGAIRHVVVDDFGQLSSFPCDVLVNPNLGASPEPYRDARRVLVGPSYALLRREIREMAAARSQRSARGDRLLVCLGGGAWPASASRLLQALGNLTADGISVRATVAGPVPAGIEAVAPASLPAHLGWADVAVISGGVVKYEAAAGGLPVLIAAVTGHQRPIAAAFASTGAARYMGALEELDATTVAAQALSLLADPEACMEMSRAARELVDGRGAQRVADTLLNPEID